MPGHQQVKDEDDEDGHQGELHALRDDDDQDLVQQAGLQGARVRGHDQGADQVHAVRPFVLQRVLADEEGFGRSLLAAEEAQSFGGEDLGVLDVQQVEDAVELGDDLRLVEMPQGGGQAGDT